MTKVEEASPSPRATGYPSLTELRWRVDVTLSTNKAKRILKPYVLLHLGTSDGKVELFEVTLEQFQKFRYAISRSLNEVLKIEQNDQIQRLRK